jgi:hypothetical protein
MAREGVNPAEQGERERPEALGLALIRFEISATLR